VAFTPQFGRADHAEVLRGGIELSEQAISVAEGEFQSKVQLAQNLPGKVGLWVQPRYIGVEWK
jgi:hypothetical protein